MYFLAQLVDQQNAPLAGRIARSREQTEEGHVAANAGGDRLELLRHLLFDLLRHLNAQWLHAQET